MTPKEEAALQAAALRLSAKLQSFYAALPDDERQVMALLFRRFATTDRPIDATRTQLEIVLDDDVLAGEPPRKQRRSRRQSK